MPNYSNNASCSTELFEALNDTDGFSQVSTNAKKYLLVFGVRKNVSILDFKALCIDINLKWLSLCSSAIEGDHIHIKLTKTACQILDKITVKSSFKIFATYFQLALCFGSCARSFR